MGWVELAFLVSNWTDARVVEFLPLLGTANVSFPSSGGGELDDIDVCVLPSGAPCAHESWMGILLLNS